MKIIVMHTLRYVDFNNPKLYTAIPREIEYLKFVKAEEKTDERQFLIGFFLNSVSLCYWVFENIDFGRLKSENHE